MNFEGELDYKRTVADALRTLGWQIQEHEDKLRPFIPDLSFSANHVDGWIEVKYCKNSPKTLGSIKHYTTGQEDWLIRHGRAGCGHCYLLVGTPTESRLVRWSELRNARGATWIAMAGLCKLVVPHPPGAVAALADAVGRAVRVR